MSNRCKSWDPTFCIFVYKVCDISNKFGRELDYRGQQKGHDTIFTSQHSSSPPSLFFSRSLCITYSCSTAAYLLMHAWTMFFGVFSSKISSALLICLHSSPDFKACLIRTWYTEGCILAVMWIPSLASLRRKEVKRKPLKWKMLCSYQSRSKEKILVFSPTPPPQKKSFGQQRIYLFTNNNNNLIEEIYFFFTAVKRTIYFYMILCQGQPPWTCSCARTERVLEIEKHFGKFKFAHSCYRTGSTVLCTYVRKQM